MTQKHMLDFILNDLYRDKESNEYQSIVQLLKNRGFTIDSQRDWFPLREILLNGNLIEAYNYGDGDLIILTQQGIDFCETNSFRHPGTTLLETNLLNKAESHMNPLVTIAVEKLYQESDFQNDLQAIKLREMVPQELSNLYSDEDKIDFLNAYLERMDRKIQRHRREGCNDSATCRFESTDRIVKALVAQELKKIEDAQKRREKESLSVLGSTINIHSNTGVVNLGKVEGDIYNYTQQLQQNGHKDVSEAIEKIVQAVKDSQEVSEQDKLEYLETLKVLSEEAVKPREERLPAMTLKKMIQFGLGTLNTLSSLSTITGVTLPTIMNYFLMGHG